jgi:hypothetical protein
MREFVIDLTAASDLAGFAAAFNAGFCHSVGGHWSGNNWDAFSDYLSWPEEPAFRLVFPGWRDGACLASHDRWILEQILSDHRNIEVIRA